MEQNKKEVVFDGKDLIFNVDGIEIKNGKLPDSFSIKESYEISAESLTKLVVALGDGNTLAEKHKEIEKKLYPLRIDSRTIIYVTKDKLTPEYAEKKRKTLGLAPAVEVKGHASRLVDMDKLRRMVNDGMKSKDIAYEMGVAASTISTYIRKYGLRDKG